MARHAFGAMLVIAGVLSGCLDCRRIEAAPEATLRTDLRTFRDVLEQYHGDRSRYPAKLGDLVTEGYLRHVPIDPFTKSDSTWIAVYREDGSVREIVDVKSGATGNGLRWSAVFELVSACSVLVLAVRRADSAEGPAADDRAA